MKYDKMKINMDNWRNTNETKKCITLTVILTLLFSLFITKSYAADEIFELQLETSSATVHPRDSFSVNIILDNMNITSGDQGIGAYQAKIVYDTNILELVEVTPANGWEVLENEGDMVANTSNAEVVKERTYTATIQFKVLENAVLGDTTISLESIQGSSGTTTIDGTGVSGIVKIEEVAEENPPVDDDNQDDNQNNEQKPSNNGGTTNRNQVGTTNIDPSGTSNKTLPKTGITNIIIIAIAIVIITAIIFYIKYRRAV